MENPAAAEGGDIATNTRAISLYGEFDMANQEELARTLRPAEDAEVAIIDMTHVEFMDSTAISCLVRLKRAMVANGRTGVVQLVHVNRRLARVFEICGLEQTFEIQPREER